MAITQTHSRMVSDVDAGSTYLTSSSIGTAAPLDVGTSANNVVQLDSNAKIPTSLLDTGVTAGKIIEVDSNNKLPAVDGSQLTGILSKYDSGWVTTDGSTTVANGATLTFSHGLSTSALNAQIWVSGASDGSYPYLMDIQETFSNTSMVGAGITNITSTQITIQFSDSGYVYMNSSGQNATSTVNGHDAASSGYVPFTSKYVRVVAIG